MHYFRQFFHMKLTDFLYLCRRFNAYTRINEEKITKLT